MNFPEQLFHSKSLPILTWQTASRIFSLSCKPYYVWAECHLETHKTITKPSECWLYLTLPPYIRQVPLIYLIPEPDPKQYFDNWHIWPPGTWLDVSSQTCCLILSGNSWIDWSSCMRSETRTFVLNYLLVFFYPYTSIFQKKLWKTIIESIKYTTQNRPTLSMPTVVPLCTTPQLPALGPYPSRNLLPQEPVQPTFKCCNCICLYHHLIPDSHTLSGKASPLRSQDSTVV